MSRKEKIGLLLLVVIATAPFVVNLRDTFLSDDWDWLRITRERDQPLYEYFATNYEGTRDRGSYRPMMNVFWVTHEALYGLEPIGYHASLILLHVVNTLLVYLILLRLPWIPTNRRTVCAFFTALFFAILPSHAEAVAWIAAVNDPLMTFFYLLSLLALLRARDASSRRTWWYIGSLISFTLSLLTKEMALTLPLVVGPFILLDSLHGKGRSAGATIKRTALLATPYLALLALYFFVRWYATGVFFGYYSHDVDPSGEVFFLSYASMMIGHLFSNPWRTVVTEWVFSVKDVVLGATALFGMIALLFAAQKRRGRVMFALGAAWLVTLLPLSSFVLPISKYMSEEGERWIYLPSVFFCALVAYVLTYVFLVRRYVAVILVALIVLFWTTTLFEKTWRWHEGALLARQTIASFLAIAEREKYDGIVAVGRPETFHGVLLFRTGFPQAIELMGGRRHDILPIAYTWYEKGQQTSVRRTDARTFVYETAPKHQRIYAPLETVSDDYRSSLQEYYREWLFGEYVGSEFRLELSRAFEETNNAADKKIGILFFNDGEWLPHTF